MQAMEGHRRGVLLPGHKVQQTDARLTMAQSMATGDLVISCGQLVW